MKTTCPAVAKVCGPMNQPVPIQVELSAAVILNDACMRQGWTDVFRIWIRSSLPMTLSCTEAAAEGASTTGSMGFSPGASGPYEASAMLGNAVVSGADIAMLGSAQI